ncbi:unnamed protein product [Cyprideis torosa]|uniref:Fatty acyl-CoA reductase n=1 Tax=Cyprideis torosa TaxID=163714 RepID=A0A7R8ZLJ3_9CRUS|nr:unnamed protein product [Cyprideis torosa]CAG0886834.1 unnamed protein product [Cyprideis torosa]
MKVMIFEGIRKSYPERLNLVMPIAGDIGEKGLGISPEDEAKLTAEVSIIFHVAATVKFEAPMKESIQFNVLGTQRVLDLARKMSQLAAVVHVSTAYCNCQMKEIFEYVYPAPIDVLEIVRATEWMDEKMLNALTPHLIGERPNTYTYTKALAENLIHSYYTDLPVAIVRPSIVVGSHQEPFPGWSDSLNGPAGLMVVSGRGILRSFYCDKTLIADFIPVDMVINCIVVAAWYSATRHPKLMIYNVSTGVLNPARWEDACDRFLYWTRKRPFRYIAWYPGLHLTTNRVEHCLISFFTQILPSALMDIILKCLCRKDFFMKYQNRIAAGARSLEYFSTKEWKFHTENVPMVISQMHPEDRKNFDFDVTHIDWERTAEWCMNGAKKYILREEETRGEIWRQTDRDLKKGNQTGDRELKKGNQTGDRELKKGYQIGDRDLKKGNQTGDRELKKGNQTGDRELKKGNQTGDRELKKKLKKGYQIGDRELKKGNQTGDRELKKGYQIGDRELKKEYQTDASYRVQRIRVLKCLADIVHLCSLVFFIMTLVRYRSRISNVLNAVLRLLRLVRAWLRKA